MILWLRLETWIYSTWRLQLVCVTDRLKGSHVSTFAAVDTVCIDFADVLAMKDVSVLIAKVIFKISGI